MYIWFEGTKEKKNYRPAAVCSLPHKRIYAFGHF